MRIFIHNVDTFVGKILVNELRRAEGGCHRTFGTMSPGGSQDEVPAAVKRLCARDDPKKVSKMLSTLQSCKVVVLDLYSCSREDLDFAMRAFRNAEEIETDVTFILISSVMVWAHTDSKAITREPGTSEALRDSDYLHREPPAGSKFEQWKEMEDLVLSTFNREGSKVKGLIVAGGILYGAGEGVFQSLFKKAWCGEMEHAILGKGTNAIPTVHVRDLARLVRSVMDNPDVNAAEAPYFLAVDQPLRQGSETPAPLTQAELVQGIVDEMCDPFKVPYVHEPEPFAFDPESTELDAAAQAELMEKEELRLTMLLNLQMQASKQMLDPEFSAMAEPHPSGWHCKEGMVKHIRMIAQEFCETRKLRAMRVLVAGPPASGKSTLAENVSKHFRIPHHDLPADGFKQMTDTLSERVCRYRGYVLDAGLAGFDRVNKVFRYEVEVPKEPVEEGQEGEGAGDAEEEGGEPREPVVKQPEFALHDDIVPSFVIVTQAPPKVLEGFWIRSHGAQTLDKFRKQMEEYELANNAETSMHLTAFFLEVAKVGILNLPIVGRDEDELFESTRIYMEEQGRPFNYLPTEEEVATEVRERREQRFRAEAEQRCKAKLAAMKELGEAHEEDSEQRQQLRRRLIAEHEVAQQQLQEMPLRDYLMEYMIPSLTEGLIEVCKVLPDNPSEYLANYLEEHASSAAAEP